MTSTPSASALTAVLRCRGNILARNPPTKRPSSSAYSLAVTGGSPTERTRSNQTSAWEAFLQGDRVLVGRGLAVAYTSPRVDGKMSREKNSRQTHKLCHPKLSQSAGDPHSAVHGVQNALARHQARRPTSSLPRINAKCSEIIQKIKYETCAVCNMVFAKKTDEFPVLKVTITSPCLLKNAGQIPSFVFSWSIAKSTCLSLTALVSEFLCLKLAVLWRSSSSPRDALQHQTIRHNALQANGQTHNPTDLPSFKDNSGSGQVIPGDRPN